MTTLATILARYGNTIPPGLRGPFALVVLGVAAVAYLVWMANQKDEPADNSTKPDADPPKAPGSNWKCPKCGEELEPQFMSCWKCGTAKETGEAP